MKFLRKFKFFNLSQSAKIINLPNKIFNLSAFKNLDRKYFFCVTFRDKFNFVNGISAITVETDHFMRKFIFVKDP